MTTLAALLDAPIRWRGWNHDADLLAFLADLQANVLKGHGRDHTSNTFLSFAGMTSEDIRALLAKLSYLTTSALDQLRSAEAFKAANVSGGRIVCVFLAKGAYEKLGVPDSEIPSNAAFRAGMRVRGQLPTLTFSIGDLPGLNDPAPAHWEAQGPWAPHNAEPDAMILVADDDPDLVTQGAIAIQHVVNGSGATLLGHDRGQAQRRKQRDGHPKGEGIEHFGYVDGRSQPLFLEEDLAGEPKLHWNPEFKPSQFIVADPAQSTPFSAGSYFVYRKLEQDVKAFSNQEDALGELFSPEIGERAGALVVGRFEDGTPVVLSDEPLAGEPTNDFNYDGQDGARCPFKGHIRKTNPRHNNDFERGRIMARRGITYGERAARKPDGDFSDQPRDNVGLLFMAYMADIGEQFEFTQAAWAGNPDFEVGQTGIDAVIGQRPNRPATTDAHWTDAWTAQTQEFDFKTSVKLMGGDYFFAPSISFLQRA